MSITYHWETELQTTVWGLKVSLHFVLHSRIRALTNGHTPDFALSESYPQKKKTPEP